MSNYATIKRLLQVQLLSNEMNNFSFCTHTRHVILPKDIAKKVPNRLMSEQEWRGLGVQQSQGWEHYMRWDPGKDGSKYAHVELRTCYSYSPVQIENWAITLSGLILNFRDEG